MDGGAAGFDWDEGNREKCRKHGVSIDEIEALLSGEPRVAPDLKHSAREDRFIAVGRNAAGRPLFVAFTFRTRGGRRLVRLGRRRSAQAPAAGQRAVIGTRSLGGMI
jgi:uncharacterized protein